MSGGSKPASPADDEPLDRATILALTLGSLADGVVAQDAAGRLVYANDAAARIVGYPSADALLHAPYDEITSRFTVTDEHGHSTPLGQLAGRLALAAGPPAERVLGYHRPGEDLPRWLAVRVTAVRDAHDRIVLIVTSCRDITAERRVTERRLLLAEASRTFADVGLDLGDALDRLTRRVVAALGDSCVVRLLSADGAWLEPTANYHPDPAAREFGEAMLRATPQARDEGLNGRVMATGEAILIPVVDQAPFEAAIKPEYRAYHERFGTHSVLIVPLRARGQAIGVLSAARETPGNPYSPDDQALLQELADRAAVAIDNARLYLQAQEAIRARDQFLAIAAHELRTPITRLRGYAELLERTRRRGNLDEDRLSRYLPVLDESAGQLAALLDDMLDISRLRTGQLPLHPEPLDLAAFARRVVERHPDPGPAHRLVSVIPANPVPIRADPARLEQVLNNMLDNAIKYSPAGGEVQIIVERDGAEATLRVRDAGIGLPPGSAEAIFAPFGRATNATERQIPGLGLGLHLAHEILSRHGGRIRAESAGEEQGTTVSLWLPVIDAGTMR